MDVHPYGTYSPTALQRWAIGRGGDLKPGFFGKQAASILKRLAGARSGRPVDIELFNGVKARLHGQDNSCERRVLCTPQFWDAAERAFIAEAIRNSESDAPFYYVDIGANAGLYALFVAGELARAGRRLKAVLLEPEPEMRRRLQFNLAANKIAGALVLPWAAAAEAGRAQFAVSTNNRGESRLSGDMTADRPITVECRPLLAALDAGDILRPDLLKIDIEGGEYAVLRAFFDSAPADRLPGMILIETFHEKADARASALCEAAGYRPVLATKLNTIYARS